jgi:hypothetical protein
VTELGSDLTDTIFRQPAKKKQKNWSNSVKLKFGFVKTCFRVNETFLNAVEMQNIPVISG